MGVITLPTTFVDGTVPTAAQFNGDFNAIINEFNGNITNANIGSSAAIAYSKLNLATSIVNADVSASAAIAESKVTFSGSGHGHTGGSDGKSVAVNRAFAWYVAGTQVTGTNFSARYVAPQALTIVKCWLIVRTAPTGAAILIDINKNGSTIWSTQGNRATIAAGATTGNTTTFNTTALAAGDYLDLDIDQVGSTVAGADLTVVLETSQP